MSLCARKIKLLSIMVGLLVASPIFASLAEMLVSCGFFYLILISILLIPVEKKYYITENIIAMHFPADDLSSGLFGYFEGFYRNHMQEVIRFFEMHYKAYCTIDGIPVDVLITGAAQNRAVEGDLVAITVDPVVYWTRMKGPNIACNPVIGGDAVVREVSETNGNHSLKKGQTDASCRFENSSNGLPVLHRMHYHHKNSGFSQAVKCENGHATVPESYEKDLEGKTEAARALQRICSMIYSHPSRRPTG